MGLLKELATKPDSMKSQVEEKLGEEVLAVGELRQGKEPTTMSTFTGTALIGLLRRPQFKPLPRHFVMAITANRAVAFKGISVGDEYEKEEGVIVRGEIGSWPREGLSIDEIGYLKERPDSGTMALAGERFPVWRPSFAEDHETDELFELLGQCAS